MKPVGGIPLLWLATVATAQTAPKIPLVEGLTIVNAVYNSYDYESFHRVDSINGRGVYILFSAPGVKTPVRRIVPKRALESSSFYLLRFAQNYPDVVPASTALGASRATLTELKAGQAIDYRCCRLPRHDNGPALRGTISRVGSDPVRLPVIVNDQPVELPAIHARGNLGGEASEFWFLDDPDNPIALKWKVGVQHLTVIRISFPARQIAQSLEKTGRADVYGIYFDVGSAVIRPESEPVLKDIADALARNPAWKLSVEGHTDSIGTDASNLDLSKRRSAAVKEALVGRYQVSAARLATTGHGESKPKADNATLEGRARNRRVELIRQ